MMSEQEEFLSPEHNKLLNFAIWAKYLAWVVLVIYVFQTGFVIIQRQVNSQQMQAVIGDPISSQEYWDRALDIPIYYLIDIGSDMIYIFLKGVIFYIVLKGISLGLYMIVETDVNYRKQENHGDIL